MWTPNINIMQEYAVKRGCDKKTGISLEERIAGSMRERFGVEPTVAGDHYTLSFGVLKRLEAWPGERGRTVFVDTESDLSVEDDDLILDTNRRFRKFLSDITCFTTKERSKKMQKS